LETVKEGDAMASLTQMMIERKCRDAAGESLDGMRLSTHDISPIIGLIEGGLSLEKDILPAIRAKASRSPPGSIRSWKLFALAVQDSVAGRKFGREAAVSAKPPLRVVDTGPKKSQAEIEREAKEFFDASLKRALEGYV